MAFTFVTPATITVTTADTPVQLTQVEVVRATIQALAANTGDIYVGDSTVDKDGIGIRLDAGEKYDIMTDGKEPFDLSSVWIDATVNGEKATVMYYKKA